MQLFSQVAEDFSRYFMKDMTISNELNFSCSHHFTLAYFIVLSQSLKIETVHWGTGL